MTVRATARCNDVGVSSATFYGITFQLSAIDDAIVGGSPTTQNVSVQVPYAFETKKADAFIRWTLFNIILNGSGSFPAIGFIDPDDIYIPFAAN